MKIVNGTDGEQVTIPEDMMTEIEPNVGKENWREGQSMRKFCDQIFPDLENNVNNPSWLKGRAILTPTNKEVDAINDLIESKMPGEGIKLSSADSVDNPTDLYR